MCGIVGYVGERNAAPILLDGLQKLEYRGYDSAGIAVAEGGKFTVVKRKGRVKGLSAARSLVGKTGVGHTRWATHGAPSERNAHPHLFGGICVVHNGIVENAAALKAVCEARGETFSSETDSEVIAHLIAAEQGDLLHAVRAAAEKLVGSYAIAVLSESAPDTIVCARKASPLVVGYGEDGLFVASDIPAIAAAGRRVYALADGEFAVLKKGTAPAFYDASLRPVEKREIAYDAEEDIPEKRGFRHFMKKEIAEVPEAVARSIPDLSKSGFSELYEVLCQTEYLHIVACGTAYHSGLCMKHAVQKFARLPAEAFIASEYRYSDPIVPKNTLAVAVSQSGETADTLAAAALAKERGARVLAVTNVPYSSLERMSDFVLPTRAGREIAVAATKSFNAQLAALYALAGALAESRGKSAPPLAGIQPLVREAVAAGERVRSWTPYFVGAKSVFFLGRGADYVAAREGSLKLKEISYLPSEGYPAGELKHGTLALVDGRTPVVAVVTDPALADKTMNAVHEVYARGAAVFLITNVPACLSCAEITASVLLPKCEPAYSPMLSSLPLQLLAYYVAIARGNDPDKPRNLAKSVTVE